VTDSIVSHEKSRISKFMFQCQFQLPVSWTIRTEASGQSLVLGHISDERQHSFMNARSNLWPFSLCTSVPTGGSIPRKTLHIKQDKCTAVAEMGNHLATIDMSQKEGVDMPLSWRTHLVQCSLGRSLPTYQVASWSINPFGHYRRVPKTKRRGCAHYWRGASNTTWSTYFKVSIYTCYGDINCDANQRRSWVAILIDSSFRR